MINCQQHYVFFFIDRQKRIYPAIGFVQWFKALYKLKVVWWISRKTDRPQAQGLVLASTVLSQWSPCRTKYASSLDEVDIERVSKNYICSFYQHLSTLIFLVYSMDLFLTYISLKLLWNTVLLSYLIWYHNHLSWLNVNENYSWYSRHYDSYLYRYSKLELSYLPFYFTTQIKA